jgi:hypothetical protein
VLRAIRLVEAVSAKAPTLPLSATGAGSVRRSRVPLAVFQRQHKNSALLFPCEPAIFEVECDNSESGTSHP